MGVALSVPLIFTQLPGLRPSQFSPKTGEQALQMLLLESVAKKMAQVPFYRRVEGNTWSQRQMTVNILCYLLCSGFRFLSLSSCCVTNKGKLDASQLENVA